MRTEARCTSSVAPKSGVSGLANKLSILTLVKCDSESECQSQSNSSPALIERIEIGRTISGARVARQNRPTLMVPGMISNANRGLSIKLDCIEEKPSLSFNQITLPEIVDEEEKEAHDFLDSLGLNQVNVKELVNDFGSRFKASPALRLSQIQSGSPSLLLKRAQRLKLKGNTSTCLSSNALKQKLDKLAKADQCSSSSSSHGDATGCEIDDQKRQAKEYKCTFSDTAMFSLITN